MGEKYFKTYSHHYTPTIRLKNIQKKNIELNRAFSEVCIHKNHDTRFLYIRKHKAPQITHHIT